MVCLFRSFNTTQELLAFLSIFVFILVVVTIVLGIKNKDRDYFVVSIIFTCVVGILVFGIYLNDIANPPEVIECTVETTTGILSS